MGLIVLSELSGAHWSRVHWGIPLGPKQIIASSTNYDPKSGLL